MRPLFTIHAAEYLVGSYIEEKLRLKVWVPGKDNGIDLLVTDKGNTGTRSIQVKWSKDYLPGLSKRSIIRRGIKASGWWQLNLKTLENSPADFWIIVLYGLSGWDSIIATPVELLEKCRSLDRASRAKGMDVYFCVTSAKKAQCWETRNLLTADLEQIASDRFQDESRARNFTEYLNKWDRIGLAGKLAHIR